MRSKPVFAVLATIVVLMSACQNGVVYSHYEHVDSDGWERSDTMHFYIPPVKQDGIYRQQLMLRTDNSLPFLGISVIVEQEILPRRQDMRKCIDCKLMENNGHVTGDGISLYQYRFDVDSMELYEGDSIHIAVTHHMKLETMPGITDIGMLISK